MTSVTGRLPSDLLNRSPEESSRLVCLSYLDEIDAAERRLRDAQDTAALHDFRVGLRRLRSCLRAYRDWLSGSVSGKMRKRLRELAQATSLGRDIEVQLTWLGTQQGRIEPQEVQGFFWFTGRQDGRKLDLFAPATADVARRYARTAVRLRRRLGILRIEVRRDNTRKPVTFGQVTGELIVEQVARLRRDLLGVRDAASVEEAHRARIAVKRLRYLLEPVARSNRRVRAIVPRLKLAQDLLGEHHDMHVLVAAIASARSGLSGDSGAATTLQPGLVRLERLAMEHADGAFERFRALQEELRSRVLIRTEEVGRSLQEDPISRSSEHPMTESPTVPAAVNGHPVIPDSRPDSQPVNASG
jgi:CHAD domain-containing protein